MDTQKVSTTFSDEIETCPIFPITKKIFWAEKAGCNDSAKRWWLQRLHILRFGLSGFTSLSGAPAWLWTAAPLRRFKISSVRIDSFPQPINFPTFSNANLKRRRCAALQRLLRNQGKSENRVKYGLPEHGYWVWRSRRFWASFGETDILPGFILAWSKRLRVNTLPRKDARSRTPLHWCITVI